MTNPKLREMLEAALNKHDDRYIEGSGPHIKTIEQLNASRASAALAVFTQYLQEPDVVRKASMRICRETHEPLNSSKHMAMSMDISMNGELYERLAAAALNSIGGE